MQANPLGKIFYTLCLHFLICSEQDATSDGSNKKKLQIYNQQPVWQCLMEFHFPSFNLGQSGIWRLTS